MEPFTRRSLLGQAVGAAGLASALTSAAQAPAQTASYGNSSNARGAGSTADLHTSWTIPYQPGTLRAVGTKEGKEFVAEVGATSEAAAVELKVDRDSIAADRQDLTHVIVGIVDAQGRMVPDAANEVTFEVQGEGKLIGVENGDMRDLAHNKGKSRKALNGMCLAFVQSTAKPGSIRINATSPGLKPASITVQSQG